MRCFSTFAGELILLSIAVLSICGCGGPNLELTPDLVVDSSYKVKVIAHRGDSRHAPENTIPAFRLAIDLKVDLIELDYFESVDGIPIVIHDKTLDRTTNAAKVLGRSGLRVDAVKSTELQKLDAGSWFDAKFTGTKLASLDEALDLIQSKSMTLIEHKGGEAKTCIELLRQKGMIRDVVVQSFDWEFVAQCHQLEPTLSLAALCKTSFSEAKLDEIEKTGAKIAVWKESYLGKKQIATIHGRGMQAWVYTVNNPKRSYDLIQAGIDGIITDAPNLLLRQLSRAKD